MAEITVHYSGVPVTRAEALASGLRYYFTGKPCIHGHIAQRFASGCECCRCSLLKQQPGWVPTKRVPPAIIQIIYRGAIRSRKEALLANASSYFTGRPCANGHIAKRRVANSHCLECDRLRASGYYLRNRDRALAAVKAAYRRNPAPKKEWVRLWRKAHPDRHQEQGERRRTAKRGNYVSPVDVADLFEKQKGRCAHCLKKLGRRFHIDHIVPIAKGGAHDKGNLQLLHPECNYQKASKDPIAFARENGRLL